MKEEKVPCIFKKIAKRDYLQKKQKQKGVSLNIQTTYLKKNRKYFCWSPFTKTSLINQYTKELYTQLNILLHDKKYPTFST